MNIKVLFLNCTRRFGTSKKTGNPYDMHQMNYVMPLNTGKFGGMTVQGFGYEPKEMEVLAEVLNMCSSIQAFEEVELTLTVDPMRPEKAIVSAIKSLKRKAA